MFNFRLEVVYLKRINLEESSDEDLEEGEYRELIDEEIALLKVVKFKKSI